MIPSIKRKRTVLTTNATRKSRSMGSMLLLYIDSRILRLATDKVDGYLAPTHASHSGWSGTTHDAVNTALLCRLLVGGRVG
jgi:hypothetical protein